MNGLYIPDEAQCPICGRILPSYPGAVALLEERGWQDYEALCYGHEAKPTQRNQGFARTVRLPYRENA